MGAVPHLVLVIGPALIVMSMSSPQSPVASNVVSLLPAAEEKGTPSSLPVTHVLAIGNAQSVMQMSSHRRENASSVVSPNRLAVDQDLERETRKAKMAEMKCVETSEGAIVLAEIDVGTHMVTLLPLAVVETRALVGLTQCL